jgi:hypothetical protein
MAQDNPSPNPASSGKIKRLQIGLNVFTQVLIVVALVGMINFIGFRQFKRWDLSHDHKYALSSMTTNLLSNLQKPVKAIVFFNPGIPIAGDVNQLLREYEFTSKKKFEVEMVNPYSNIVRAKELATKYKFGAQDNIVILDYNGRTKFVNADAMAEFDRMDQVAMMSGQPPRLKAFKGEEAITGALLEITEDRQNKVYFTAGHGEPDLKSPAVATFKAYTERQNVKLDTLKLNEVDKVPEDASALVIFGARADFSEREIQLVSEYFGKNGRLFVLLDPDGQTSRLNTFLLSHGITPTNDRVIRTQRMPARDENQQLTLVTAVLLSPSGTIAERSRPITKDLAGVDTAMLGATESLQIDQVRAQTENLRITPLIESSKVFWGETEYKGAKETPFFDPKKDHQGPLTLAAAVEKGALADARVKVETSRLIAVGNAGWLTDEGLRQAEVGVDFAMNSLNWLLNREQLIGIPPKTKEPVRLDLNESKLSKLAFTVIVLIPGIVAALGFGVWLVRRS